MAGRIPPAAAKVVIAALLGLYARMSFTRYLINDDYQTLYTAWLQSEGKRPGKDFFVASYYVLIDLVSPLFRLAPNTWLPLVVSRLALVGVLLLASFFLCRIGTRLFDADTGWLSPVMALGTAAMLHRGLDLRPDLLTTVLWLAIIDRLLLHERRARDDIFVGALFGAVIVSRFKGVIIGPLIVVIYLYHPRVWTGPGVARRLAAWGFRLGIGTVAILAPYLLWIARNGGAATFVEVQRTLVGGMGEFAHLTEALTQTTLFESVKTDGLYWVAAAIGLLLRLLHRRRHEARETRIVVGVLALAVASVALNPAYYAYNLVTLQTLLAPFAAHSIAVALRGLFELGRAQVMSVVGTLSVVCLGLMHPELIVDLATTNSNAHQRALSEFLLRFTPPDAPVFALEGVGLFRPSVYHWRLSWILTGRYRRGEMSFARELAETPPELIVQSYRVPAWLTPADRAYIGVHYVPIAPLLLVPGFASTSATPQSFELLVTGLYEVITSGEPCEIDGAAMTPDRPVTLTAGTHRISTPDGTCVVRRYYPKEARALVANPTWLPYFTPPGLRMPQPLR